MAANPRVNETLRLLDLHYEAYEKIKPFADKHRHPHPTDTRGWSQILVSALTGIKGYERKKGPDLADGSDVKAANCWDAIDTPRFNGCIKAGTLAATANSLASLDKQPFLFFVLWDSVKNSEVSRCRFWVVRTQHDARFREMAERWYEMRRRKEIKSTNFQLHPPRNLDSDVFRNNCGTLQYPLLFAAHRQDGRFRQVAYAPEVLESGACRIAQTDRFTQPLFR